MIKIIEKHYKGDGLEESYRFSIFAMVSLVIFIVCVLTYATYLFIHASGISDIAGVHVSKNLKLIAEGFQGKLYTNEEKGIKDWIIYEDAAIGLSVKHPNDFSVERISENELEFKKKNLNVDSKNQSIAYAFLISKKDVNENFDPDIFLKEKYPEIESEIKSGFYGQKEGWRTGVFKSESGIYKDVVLWKVEGIVISLESRYYSQEKREYAKIFNNVISEINFR